MRCNGMRCHCLFTIYLFLEYLDMLAPPPFPIDLPQFAAPGLFKQS